MRTLQLLVAAFAVVQLLRYGRSALLFLRPRVHVEVDPAPVPGSTSRLRAGGELEALGFVRLGVRHERAAWGALSRTVECYARPRRATYADVTEDRAGRAQVTFLTPFPDGVVVVTADHDAPSRLTEGARTGTLAGARPAQVLEVHEAAVDRTAAAHGRPLGGEDLRGRADLARAWYRGEGRRELRRGRGTAVVIAAVAVLLLLSAVSTLTRAGR